MYKILFLKNLWKRSRKAFNLIFTVNVVFTNINQISKLNKKLLIFYSFVFFLLMGKKLTSNAENSETYGSHHLLYVYIITNAIHLFLSIR